MADGGEIASLFATLGLRVNAGQWAQGTAQIDQAKRALEGAFQDRQGHWRAASGRFLTMTEKAAGAAAGMKGFGDAATIAGEKAASAGHKTARSFDAAGAALKGMLVYLGASFGYEKLVKYNATVEDTKNEIAGMLALARHSPFSSELATADQLMSSLRQQAARLPGETSEYVAMLGRLTQPIIDAKLSLKDLEDLTVNSVVAAKGMHIAWDVAARDIDQAIRGQFHSVDQFTGKVLGSIGYKGEEGRSSYNALSDEKRASELKRALMQSQFRDMAEAAGKSFTGVLSTLQDSIAQFFGKIGESLFGKLKGAITQINAWLEQHKAAIDKIADTVGEALASAFEFLGQAMSIVVDYGGAVMDWIGEFIDGSELLKSALTAIGIVLAVFAIQSAIAFATNPITLIIVGITALVYAIRWLMQHPEKVRKAFHDAWEAIKRAGGTVADALKSAFTATFDFIADLPVVKELLWLAKKLGLIKDDKSGDATSTKNEKMLQDSNEMSREAFRAKYPDAGKDNEPYENVLRLTRGQQPILTAPNSAAQSSATVINVGGIGDIHVNAPNADPVAVGDQVRKVFHEELGNTLRKTKDMYG